MLASESADVLEVTFDSVLAFDSTFADDSTKALSVVLDLAFN